MIKAENISKSFGEQKAVSNISFEVEEGELFGFIGPDGAGKTTLFRILTTLLLADSGQASVFDYDVVQDFKKIRHITGYMPGRFSLYQDLTVEENLQFWASVFGTTVEENFELVEDIYSHIEPFKKRLAGQLSGGMKQKLALSCALIHRPRLLVLDEPTTGVDAVSRTEFWDMLKKLRTYGITILVSTPYMDEASLCERVALVQDGRIMSLDTPTAIVDSFSQSLWAVSGRQKYLLLQALNQFPNIQSVNAFGDTAHITTRDNTLNETELQHHLEHIDAVHIQKIKPNIEDCFLQLMQENS